MKKVIGLLILIFVLVAVSGCTQQTKTAPVTTSVPTTVPTTEATIVATPAPTTEVPVETTAVVTTKAIVANVTATATATTVPVTTATGAPTMTPSSEVTVIHITNNTFTPSVLMALPGTGITWINDDKTVHSVKMSGNHTFNSGPIVNGASWMYTFNQNEGTYQYVDGYNTNITGTIIIQNSASVLGNPTLVPLAAPVNSS